jgi:NADH-quinone oxidoreductase subunit L
VLALGRIGDVVLDRGLVSGGLTGGGTGVVEAGSALVRRLQTGLLRSYAAMMVLGLAAIALYFLVNAS